MRSANQPIPGAAVTVSQGQQSFNTFTDADGHYGFPPLSLGTWNVTVEMFGFDPLRQQVDYASAKGPVNFEIQLKESPILRRMQQARATQGQAANGTAQRGSDSVTAAIDASAAMETPAAAPSPGAQSSNESFLISGSLSPGMTEGSQADSGPDMRFGQGPDGSGGMSAANGNMSAPGFGSQTASGGGFGGPGFGGGGPGMGAGGRGGFGGGRGFGGPGGRRPGQVAGATFGNRRRRNQQIHGQASFTLQNSALNAKPFSLNGLDIPQAAYAQSRFSFIVGGPLVLPKLVKDPKTQFFLTYFGTRAKVPKLFVETVPTLAFRNGDFSQATQSLGSSAVNAPVQIFDPSTRQPFPNNVIPTTMLNSTALGLLRYYPLPSQPGNANNYQFETAQATNSDNVGLRVQREITKQDRLSLNFQYQDRSGTLAQPFGYSDSNNGYGLNASVQWTRNLSATAVNNMQIRFNRNYTQIVPYFSLGGDVAQQLGIQGTSSNPLDFGPPTLNFTNFATLSDSVATLNRNQSQGISDSVSQLKGKHTITVGGGFTRADLSVQTDPNGRGTFNFTGVATSEFDSNGRVVPGTGYDLADFLLSLPQSNSIQYSGFNEYFQQNQWTAYLQDEWKVRSNLTLIGGVRYEYFSPFSEKYGRMANLDIAPGFTAVSVATPNIPGAYTGAFPSGLINPDLNNWSPRLGLAWKLPWFKRSTIIRSGYGIYYNEQAYMQFTSLLAYQPPFAVSNSVNTSPTNILTLQKGLTMTSSEQITNTFGVSRYYRTPYAGTWNFSIQHDFGGGFFTELGYMGTKGTRLDLRSLPNESPPGTTGIASQNQLGDATGFTFDQSVGNSIFNALQFRLNRRFNRGISFTAFYQFAKSIDDSPSLGGVGQTVAQNWLDLAAERGLSSFDVRHELSGTFVLTSPVAGPGSHISAESKLGRLLKDWQLSGGITAQTGNPLTARVLGNSQQLAQTNGIGQGRADATGEPIDSGSGFFNLDAFTTVPRGNSAMPDATLFRVPEHSH